VLESK